MPVLSAPLKFGTPARAVVISMIIIKAVTGAQPATAAHVALELMPVVCSVWCLAGLARLASAGEMQHHDGALKILSTATINIPFG